MLGGVFCRLDAQWRAANIPLPKAASSQFRYRSGNLTDLIKFIFSHAKSSHDDSHSFNFLLDNCNLFYVYELHVLTPLRTHVYC